MIDNKNDTFYYFILGGLFLVAIFRPIGFDPDSIGYAGWIHYDVYEKMGEPFFILCVKVLGEYFRKDFIVRLVFLVYASLHFYLLNIFLLRFSVNKIFSLLLYFFIFFSILGLTQIRFGVASLLVIWAIEDLILEKRKKFLFKVVMATLVHYSSVLAILLLLIRFDKFNKNFYYLLIPVFIGLSSFNGLIIWGVKPFVGALPSFIGSRLLIYLSEDFVHYNFYNTFVLYFIMIYYLCLWKVDRFKDPFFRYYLRVLGWGISFYFLFSFSQTLSERILYCIGLLILVLVPWCATKTSWPRVMIFFFFLISVLLFVNINIRHSLLRLEVFF